MNTLKLHSKGDFVRLLQELLNKAGYNIIVSGIFGSETEKAVKDFQTKNNLVCDGIAGTKTWMLLQSLAPFSSASMQVIYLCENDLTEAARLLDLETAAVKAVYEVESSGRGFLTDGRPKILFEGHIFWKQLKTRNIDPTLFTAGNSDILYQKWTKDFYKGGAAEYGRLERAININEDAALESSSWGIFQILGLHYKKAGFESVKDFVNAHYESEKNHLLAFAEFIRAEGLVGYLKKMQWAKFAYRYNGPGYEKNKYDHKLAAAYKKYSAGIA